MGKNIKTINRYVFLLSSMILYLIPQTGVVSQTPKKSLGQAEYHDMCGCNQIFYINKLEGRSNEPDFTIDPAHGEVIPMKEMSDLPVGSEACNEIKTNKDDYAVLNISDITANCFMYERYTRLTGFYKTEKGKSFYIKMEYTIQERSESGNLVNEETVQLPIKRLTGIPFWSGFEYHVDLNGTSDDFPEGNYGELTDVKFFVTSPYNSAGDEEDGLPVFIDELEMCQYCDGYVGVRELPALKNLIPSHGSFSKPFQTDKSRYTLTVPEGVNQVTLTPVLSEDFPDAVITFNKSEDVASGDQCSPISVEGRGTKVDILVRHQTDLCKLSNYILYIEPEKIDEELKISFLFDERVVYEDEGYYSIDVFLNHPFSLPGGDEYLSIPFSISGDAVINNDYSLRDLEVVDNSSQLLFTPSETDKTIIVDIMDDDISESPPPEEAVLTLIPPSPGDIYQLGEPNEFILKIKDPIPKYTLTMHQSDDGAVFVNGEEVIFGTIETEERAGVPIYIKAEPNSGYDFTGWEEINGDYEIDIEDPESDDTNVKMVSEDAELQPIFEDISAPYITLAAPSVTEGIVYYNNTDLLFEGTVSDNEGVERMEFSVDENASEVFYPDEDGNWSFTASGLSWDSDNYVEICGYDLQGNKSVYPLTVKLRDMYTLTVQDNLYAEIEPVGGIQVYEGEPTPISADTDPGYYFYSWEDVSTGSGYAEFDDFQDESNVVRIFGGDAEIKADVSDVPEGIYIYVDISQDKSYEVFDVESWVNGDYTDGVQDGKTWETAFKYLRDATDFANLVNGYDAGDYVIDGIKIAEGSYYPDEFHDENGDYVNNDNEFLPPNYISDAFRINYGLDIEGGFPQGGSTVSDPETYETIFDGEVQGNDGNTVDHQDNSDLVIIKDDGEDLEFQIQGIRFIRGGNCRGTGVPGGDNGGSGINAISSNNLNLSIESCEFENNFSDKKGGAIYFKGNNLDILNSNLNSNKTEYPGGNTGPGGALMFEGNNLTINNSPFSNNRVVNGSGGGAILFEGNTLDITGSDFIENSVQQNNIYAYGGAIDANGINLKITDCLFEANSSGGRGGALSISIENVVIDRSVFLENKALIYSNYGGAIYIDANLLRFLIKKSVFVRNSSRRGGACYIDNNNSCESIKIINVLFASNDATMHTLNGLGGALYLDNTSESNIISIINSTFYNNIANNAITPGDAICMSSGANGDVYNTILWGSDRQIAFGNFNQHSSCWNQDDKGAGNDPSFLNESDLSGSDDDSWRDSNDGLNLTESSGCRDAGVNEVIVSGENIIPDSDITEADRYDGNVDIGAYEF